MSYCRWGPGSDVYCYASYDGYVVHLAARRRREDAPECPYEFGKPEYFQWVQDNYDVIYRDIEQYDNGETDWSFKKPEEFRDFLLELRAKGYLVPQHAIDRINEELEHDA
jgi:hypothetical protein